MGALRAIFSWLATSLLILILAGAAVLGGFAFQERRTADAFDGCQARLLEHSITRDRQVQFLDLCMSEKGHKKSGCNPEIYPLAICYLPRWVFWVD